MFAGDHARDFDAVLNATVPFALARFGDGEQALIEGKRYQAADPWRCDGPSWLAGPLLEALGYVDDAWHVGVPAPCCMAAHVTLGNRSATPRARTTFATLFLHGNLGRGGDLVERFRDAVVVSSSYGEIRIPQDGVAAPWDLDAVVVQLREVDRPILLAAGPCAKVIAHRYWRSQPPEKRQTILDVGSVLDVVNGRVTRYYHDPQSPLRQHRCSWMMAGLSKEPRPVNNRIRVGRPAATSAAQPAGLASVQSRGVTVRTAPAGSGCQSCKGRIRVGRNG